MTSDLAGKPYRPSCGSEGADFMLAWCDKCSKDNYPDEPFCPIIADTMLYEHDDPRYPSQFWTHDANGKPVCTAFEER